jgi:hypothetical protein
MSSSRNWSHNSFERAMEYFTPSLKLWWMEYIKITPVNYSEWSDVIYVIVEFELSKEGYEMARSWNQFEQKEVTKMISDYLKRYFIGYLNTNVGVQEFRTPANYTMG